MKKNHEVVGVVIDAIQQNDTLKFLSAILECTIYCKKCNRENQCQNIGNGKGEISSCHNVFLGNRKSCIGFKKGLKGSLL